MITRAQLDVLDRDLGRACGLMLLLLDDMRQHAALMEDLMRRVHDLRKASEEDADRAERNRRRRRGRASGA